MERPHTKTQYPAHKSAQGRIGAAGGRKAITRAGVTLGLILPCPEGRS
jgi:hypothetical protein